MDRFDYDRFWDAKRHSVVLRKNHDILRKQNNSEDATHSHTVAIIKNLLLVFPSMPSGLIF